MTTPWGEVVDQGTEFAVESDDGGRGEAHVFAGKVALMVTQQADHTQTAAPLKINLVQGEAACASAGGDIRRKAAEPQCFLSVLPDEFPIFGSGAKLDPGQSDPHWQIVASSTDPNFQPQPAIVVLHRAKTTCWVRPTQPNGSRCPPTCPVCRLTVSGRFARPST